MDDSLEKELNLIIARKVQTILKQQDVEVLMTRESDKGLYEEQTSNKKVQDMKNRCALINDTKPDCVVSIHQNSYHEEYVKGAQVFYYGSSEEGKRLAETLQERLISYVDPENHRQAKANSSYYLLKKRSFRRIIIRIRLPGQWPWGFCRIWGEGWSEYFISSFLKLSFFLMNTDRQLKMCSLCN